MPRIRTIKPEFWTSEQVTDCSTVARLLFIGLWNFADDAGIHSDSPKRLKMEVFPADDYTVDDIAALVAELVDNGLLERYEVEGASWLRVTGWEDHQVIKNPSRRHPPPPGLPQPYPSPPPALSTSYPPETERKRKGREGNIPAGPVGAPSVSFAEVWEAARPLCQQFGKLLSGSSTGSVTAVRNRELCIKAACISETDNAIQAACLDVAEDINRRRSQFDKPWGYFKSALIRVTNERYGKGSFDALWRAIEIPDEVLNPQPAEASCQAK